MDPALCIICGRLSTEMASLWQFAGVTTSPCCICSECWEKDPGGCQKRQNDILESAFRNPEEIVANAARCCSCHHFRPHSEAPTLLSGTCRCLLGKLEPGLCPVWLTLTSPMYADEGKGCHAWRLKEET